MRGAPCRDRTRRIASAMLVVWLFATVASWSNACLAQPSAAADPRGHHRLIGAGAHADGHDAAAPAAGATDERDPARQACASFCEAEPSIVAKVQTAKEEGGADARVPPPGLPVVIAFLRLTL